jgi:predicted lipid-binding transport protein (Tim44 family)
MQRPAPQPVQHAPPAQAAPTTGGGMFSGIGGTIVQGMAFGKLYPFKKKIFTRSIQIFFLNEI